MRASEALFRLYRGARATVDALGVSRLPVVGPRVVRPLGSLARRAIIGRDDLSLVDVRGHLMRMDPHLRGNAIRSAGALFHYLSFVSGEYERGTTRVFEELLRPGMVVVDVGAHVGYYTLLAARAVGETGRVVAFEPAPANFLTLCQNIEINGYRNVRPVPMAVCDRSGPVALHVSDLDSMDHSLYRVPRVTDSEVMVEATTLDEFFGEEGRRVDFIKLDVEGAEPAVLAGMRGLAERTERLTMVVECNPFALAAVGVSRGDLVRRLTAMSFTVKVISDDGLQDTDSERIERFQSGVNLLCTKANREPP